MHELETNAAQLRACAAAETLPFHMPNLPNVNSLRFACSAIDDVRMPGVLFSSPVSYAETLIDDTRAMQYRVNQNIIWDVCVVDDTGAFARWVTSDDLELNVKFEMDGSTPVLCITGEEGQFQISMTMPDWRGTIRACLRVVNVAFHLKPVYQAVPCGKTYKTVQLENNGLFCISPNGTWAVVLRDKTGTIDVFDVVEFTGAFEYKQTILEPCQLKHPTSVLITALNTILVSDDGGITEFDKSGSVLRSRTLVEADESLPYGAMALHNNELVLMKDSMLVVYNFDSGECVRVLPVRRFACVMGFTCDGELLYVRPASGIVQIDLKTGVETERFSVRPDARAWLSAASAMVAVSDHEVILSSRAGGVVLCNLRSGIACTLTCDSPAALAWSRGKLYALETHTGKIKIHL